MDSQAVTVTTLPADFSVERAAALRKSFRRHVDEGRILHVVDLDQVGLLDSAALGVLITALRTVREVGGAVALVVTRPQLLKILTITALDKIFSIYSSVDAAASGLGGTIVEAAAAGAKSGRSIGRLARGAVAAVAAVALIVGFRPAVAQTPLEPATVIGSIIEQNPNLQSYQAHVDIQVRMTSFPFLAPKLAGETYFKRPNNYEVVFTKVPSYAKGFERVYADIGDPASWERRFVVTLEGEKVVNGHHDVILRLVQRVRGMIDHELVYVDDATWHIDEMQWHYYNGGVISMTQQYRNEGPYTVIASQQATIAIPHVRAVASATYTEYRSNIALDDSIFTKATK